MTPIKISDIVEIPLQAEVVRVTPMFVTVLVLDREVTFQRDENIKVIKEATS